MTRLAGIALALVIGTFAIYGQVANHDLLYWDDNLYIFDSPALEGGLGLDALGRAFTEPYQMAWMPVTKISLLANHAFHGEAPAGYLLGNVALHALAAVLRPSARTCLLGSSGWRRFWRTRASWSGPARSVAMPGWSFPSPSD
jgi:hypothetical protein